MTQHLEFIVEIVAWVTVIFLLAAMAIGLLAVLGSGGIRGGHVLYSNINPEPANRRPPPPPPPPKVHYVCCSKRCRHCGRVL